jgi:hypothetical protein
MAAARRTSARARACEDHGVAGPPTGRPQPNGHDAGQCGVGTHRRGDGHREMSAVVHLAGYVLVDVISGGQKGRHHHGRYGITGHYGPAGQIAQHLGRRGAEHIDERGTHGRVRAVVRSGSRRRPGQTTAGQVAGRRGAATGRTGVDAPAVRNAGPPIQFVRDRFGQRGDHLHALRAAGAVRDQHQRGRWPPHPGTTVRT